MLNEKMKMKGEVIITNTCGKSNFITFKIYFLVWRYKKDYINTLLILKQVI